MSFVYHFKHLLHTVGSPLFALRRPVAPVVEEISVSLPSLPAGLENYRIAVVADLHLPDYLSTPAQVIDAVKNARPDCIFIAGDLANRYADFDRKGIENFLRELAEIAPCYAVTGNHEQYSVHLPAFKEVLADTKIALLNDEWTALHKNGETLPLYGACDRDTQLPTAQEPSILLMHYPEKARFAGENGFFVAVCGHAHGGQVRFGKRGLFSPGQGFFPKYISGVYQENNLQLVVSRGLGDSSLPIRICNKPHLPVLCLKR
jgi:predicted MPP superfamily phosphohydrolase